MKSAHGILILRQSLQPRLPHNLADVEVVRSAQSLSWCLPELSQSFLDASVVFCIHWVIGHSTVLQINPRRELVDDVTLGMQCKYPASYLRTLSSMAGETESAARAIHIIHPNHEAPKLLYDARLTCTEIASHLNAYSAYATAFMSAHPMCH